MGNGQMGAKVDLVWWKTIWLRCYKIILKSGAKRKVGITINRCLKSLEIYYWRQCTVILDNGSLVEGATSPTKFISNNCNDTHVSLEERGLKTSDSLMAHLGQIYRMFYSNLDEL